MPPRFRHKSLRGGCWARPNDQGALDEVMRAFLALDIPDDVAAALIRLQSGIPFGRPVPEENLHLTLAFFEDAPDHGLEALHEMLSALRMPPV